MKELNAKITGARIFIEDHGMLTFYIDVRYDGCSYQGFGGYDLRGPKTGKLIEKILTTLEVDDWSKLKGQAVRVRIENGLIRAMGHFLENKWIVPAEILS